MVLLFTTSLLFGKVTFAFQRSTSHCTGGARLSALCSVVLSSGCPTNQPPTKGKAFLPSPAGSSFALKVRAACLLISAVTSWSLRAGVEQSEYLSYSLLSILGKQFQPCLSCSCQELLGILLMAHSSHETRLRSLASAGHFMGRAGIDLL